MNLKALFACGAFVAGVNASANISTLITIPIADILGDHEGNLMYCLTGTAGAPYSHYASVTVGLADKAEVAIGTDLLGQTTYHAKLLLLETGGKQKFTLSGGFMNFDGVGHADGYIVGRLDLKRCRLHGGYLRSDMDRAFVGADFPVGKDWTGMAEYTSGAHGYTWAGINAPIHGLGGLNLLLAVGLPATRGDGMQHMVCLTYGFKF